MQKIALTIFNFEINFQRQNLNIQTLSIGQNNKL